MADDRTAEALDHLQTAALEFIAACRAMLDVAEEAVREPQGLMDVVTATARAAADVVATARGGQAATEGPASASRAHSGVEHISIS